jgi:predicted dehydrogenase
MAMNRRTFIKNGALTVGSFMIVPRHVLGKGFIPPSDKLNIAAIGAGGKGYSDILNAWNNDVNNVGALCDVDPSMAKRAMEKFPKATLYKDFREMLEKDKSIDAVTVSTPDHTHAVAAMAAMQLGKHVYVQKPLTHNIKEARLLTESARRYRVVSQMGNQGASGPGVKQMIDWYNKGLIGTVHTVHIWTNRPVWPQGIPVPSDKKDMPTDLAWDNWIGPAQPVEYHPGYHPFKWRGWWNFGTGALGDMGCHLIDPPYRVLGLGYPTEVESSVGSVFIKDWTPEWIPEGCPPSSVVQLKFPASKKNNSAVTVTWSDGGLRPFHPDMLSPDEILGDADGTNGVIMIGKKGIMTCGTYGANPKLFKKNGEKLEMPKVDPSVTALPEHGHQMMWAEACKKGFGSPEHLALTSSFDYAGPLTETVLMGNLAIRSYALRTPRATGNGFNYPGRKKLLWDGTNMRITNFEDANQFVGREYRTGWAAR